MRITYQAYLAIVLAAAIFACCLAYLMIWVSRIDECGVSNAPNAYLAYCDQPRFGDYEHGAFYFDLEPGLLTGLQKAEVLFVGSSRAQVGFSTEAVRVGFAQHNISYYLLGFGYAEGNAFEAAVIKRFHLRPKVIVITVDFFSRGLSQPAKAVTSGNIGPRIEYASKHWAALVSRAMCKIVGAACSTKWASIYRSTVDGRWIWEQIYRSPDAEIPIDPEKRAVIPTKYFDSNVDSVRRFLQLLEIDHGCVVITAAPNSLDAWEPLAQEIGRRLDLQVVLPELEGLATTDKSHLNKASAERWSAAVLGKMEPVLNRCIRQTKG